MASIQKSCEPQHFSVIHPIDDKPEQKRSSDGLGRIRMTRTVRIALAGMRVYLILMTLMLGYHMLSMAGVVR